MPFQLVQVLYWLALSTWFGGVLFIAVAAPIIFRTVRENNPVLPTVLSVNMEGQHGTLLAGTIVANLLGMLLRVELVCAAVMLVTIIAQWFMIDLQRSMLVSILRTAMYLAALGLVVYDWRAIWPRIGKHRQEYIDHADEPEIANAAKEKFDRYHHESVTLLSIKLFLLMGIVLFSAGISQGPVFHFTR